MSASPHTDHADGHDHHHGDHASHGTVKSYITGFVLSVILTAIPFWLVMGKVFDNAALTGILVMAFALVQIVVHMVYFLHLDTKSEGGWNMMALLFTVILVMIAITGSLWVMHHLNTNMMQMPPGMFM
ncbi:cytochrome o ubiquinol oxidase subunit IV [Roseibium algae]|uniref:Cytochrome bo(3) ubiquinol oxidase subunit 4 n=1 Tax=Roseibium algae TaxID=3123038 RepID=A0ABU8TJB9_9HYPH